MSEIDDERRLYEEYAKVEALGELPMQQFGRGERVWWKPRVRKAGEHDEGFPATVLRCGKVNATLVCAMNGSGHWYTQRARIEDLRVRTQHLAVDVIADKGMECLP